MEIDRDFGPVAPDLGWVPSIRYLMRRARLKKIFAGMSRTRVLEIGCGAGALLSELSACGFEAIGLETSAEAAAIARRFSSLNKNFSHVVTGSPGGDWDESYGLVCAFDVLEHICDESAALLQWHRWLKSDGRLLISVPAHSKKWGPGDVWAGHYRRYDRERLIKLISSHGFQVDYLECYGFPVANFTEWIGRRVYSRLLTVRGLDTEPSVASGKSGIARENYFGIYRAMATLPGRWVLKLAMELQRYFLRVDIGSGYILLARK